ncbi:hypothetical protein GCM10007932_05840 [Vibrio penaeicida]|uniref:DUF2628 domain-containing protein n=1 Tax=Vibrio penaeicida TaxID=104609 RepID=A0AAV5NLH7_9VIBR|nr:hypothetical protein GCM10007932_05840 [Vibrio penaeicida]
MKGRCPNCNTESESIPLSKKCSQCGGFSNDWFVYDWVGYSRYKRLMIWGNWVVLALCSANFLTIVLGSADPIQWLFCLLIIPSTVSLINSYQAIANPEHYDGHRLKDLSSWFPYL